MMQDNQAVFDFLSHIQSDPGLRAKLNEVCTADEVAAIAAEEGFRFTPAVLLELFERCNEAPLARSGLMDEKLIRVYLQREVLQAS
ncbi:MAG: Nif11 family protein [Cyanobacteria bacterium M_surface_10_m1_298]|nr:Nif11 family protein [Cyanobacteria bacterium M_surface_10_m1_298]